MRLFAVAFAAMTLLAAGIDSAAAAISCSDIPDAERFIGTLRPGPNTTAAQRHLDAAKRATSDKQCVAELRQVDKYARRSYAADQRASGGASGRAAPHPKCADFFHQDRPGGSDYHGPPVAGCP